MPPPTILIWQADGGAGHDLAFMYEPVRSTLVSGFSDLPQRVISKIGTPNLVHGHGVNALFRKKADLVNGLKTGDIFLWIGPVGSNAPPWRKLRERGVRTIYYQTEPFDGCQLSGSQSDEVWEFSWHNIDACGPRLRLDPPLTLRYVPLGYNAPPAAESSGSSSASAPPVTDGTEKADLLFLGYPFYKSGRTRCYDRLRQKLGGRLNSTWSLWDSNAFSSWWVSVGSRAIHLNLHKSCESSHNPVVFRTSLLLSRGASVISEHSYAKDEAEYNGLVHFAKVEQLPGLLEEALQNTTSRNGAAAAAGATGAMRPLRRPIHRNDSEKPRMRRANWISLTKMVTLFAWIAHRFESSKR